MPRRQANYTAIVADVNNSTAARLVAVYAVMNKGTANENGPAQRANRRGPRRSLAQSYSDWLAVVVRIKPICLHACGKTRALGIRWGTG